MSEEIDEITAALQSMMARALAVARATVQLYQDMQRRHAQQQLTEQRQELLEERQRRAEQQQAARDARQAQEAKERAQLRELQVERTQLGIAETRRRMEILEENAGLAQQLSQMQMGQQARHNEVVAQWAANKAVTDSDPAFAEIADAFDDEAAKVVDLAEVEAEAQRLLADDDLIWDPESYGDAERLTADTTTSILGNRDAADRGDDDGDPDETADTTVRLLDEAHPDGAVMEATDQATPALPLEAAPHLEAVVDL